MGLTCSLYDCVDLAPPGEWDLFHRHDGDLATDPRLLRVFQSTMAGQCRCWTAILRDDRTGAPAAAACLCRFSVDTMETTAAPARRVIGLLRRAWPGALRFGVLFCGLPVPSGENHLRVADGADPSGAVGALDRLLRDLARRERAAVIVVKELDEPSAARVDPALLDRGYLRGDVPGLYVLPGGFASFNQFRDRLRSDYRRNILHSQAKFDAAPFRVEHVSGADIPAAYTDDVHRLYRSVRDHSAYRLETLPAPFFREAGAAFGDGASLTLISLAGRPVAFSFGILAGGVFHQLYVGYDPVLNGEADLYFNIEYLSLDRAFALGAREIRLGQTAGAFKARLGARPVPLCFFARGASGPVHLALRAARSRAFPPVENVPAHDVFKSAAAPAPMATKQMI